MAEGKEVKSDAKDKHWVVGKTDPITDHYELDRKIGQPGQFGYARVCKKKGTDEQRAVKIVFKGRFTGGSDTAYHFQQLRGEIKVMQSIKQENIISLYDVYEDEENLYLVMELCKGGELFDRIQQRGQYSEQDAAKVLRQMFKAIQFLHSKGIAHCDLKPDNFLFMTSGDDSAIKVIDFGMSKFVERRKYFKSFCGTPFYVAPEVILGKYAEHCDMWSLGVVMFVMLFGYPPFYADQEKYGSFTDDKILSLVKKGFDPVTKKGYGAHFPQDIPCSDSAKDLIAKLLVLDTATRLSAEEALEHPWLSGKTASDKPILPKVVENLKKFDNNSRFKNVVLSVMSDSLTEDELKELDRTFRAIDKNGDGTITFAEMKEALEGHKDLKIDQEELKKIVAMADINGDGVLSYEELKLTCVHRKLIAKEERIWSAFCKLDLNGDGRITREEIAQVLGQEAGDVLEMIKEVDKNGDGSIDYDEFITLWSQHASKSLPSKAEDEAAPAAVAAAPADAAADAPAAAPAAPAKAE